MIRRNTIGQVKVEGHIPCMKKVRELFRKRFKIQHANTEIQGVRVLPGMQRINACPIEANPFRLNPVTVPCQLVFDFIELIRYFRDGWILGKPANAPYDLVHNIINIK